MCDAQRDVGKQNELVKIKQDRILSASVGSYPKPKYLYERSGRRLLDNSGLDFYELEAKIGTTEFQKRLDQAALMAIQDQNQAGIDLSSDGEQRRGHYVLGVLKHLDGIDFNQLKTRKIREGHYERDLPIVVDKITDTGAFLFAEYEFLKQHTQGIAKMNVPGPSTVIDSVVDEYYCGDLERMAMDYAQAIRHEIKRLVDAGCRVIQIDDPLLLRDPTQAKAWGLSALQACFQGLEHRASYVVHICCGYPDKRLENQGIHYKANENYYQDVLGWLSESDIDIVSIEGAQCDFDVSVLPAIGEKTVMLGVLDVGDNKVESVDDLVKRGCKALEYLPAEQLILSPDCGMVQLQRDAARQKLIHLAQAVSVLNGSTMH